MKVICGWCRENIEVKIESTKYGHNQLRCPKCFRNLPSTKKIKLEDGRHIHKEHEEGDII
jgi:ubiquitin C-terminal hydrolase